MDAVPARAVRTSGAERRGERAAVASRARSPATVSMYSVSGCQWSSGASVSTRPAVVPVEVDGGVRLEPERRGDGRRVHRRVELDA